MGETAVVFGEPRVDDSGMPKAVRERHGHRLHSLFFAVYDRPPYVLLVVYYLDPERFDRELDNERPEEAPNNRKPDSWIRITVLETLSPQNIAF